MRHSWIALLVICGALGFGGYHLGIALALWDDPEASGVLGVLWSVPVMVLLGLRWGSPRTKVLRGALTTLGALGLLAASCAPESKFLPNPYVDTCFAYGFNRLSFELVHPGMSPAEVQAVTGAPKSRRPRRTWGYLLPGDPDQIWIYSSDACSWIGDYAWRSYEIGFRDGAVVAVSTAWRYD